MCFATHALSVLAVCENGPMMKAEPWTVTGCARCGLLHANRGSTDGCIQALREIVSALTLRVEALEDEESDDLIGDQELDEVMFRPV